MKKYIAELLGTFTLALVVGLSLAGSFPPATPLLAGLTLGLFVYTIGAISGAHINPAVTIGAWSIKKIGNKDALWYIVAQFIGAASVVYNKAHAHVSGVVIGGSLLLGIIIAAALGSNGVLNPAVALGIGSFNLAYLFGPIVGAVFGMQAYKYLGSEEGKI